VSAAAKLHQQRPLSPCFRAMGSHTARPSASLEPGRARESAIRRGNQRFPRSPEARGRKRLGSRSGACQAPLDKQPEPPNPVRRHSADVGFKDDAG
jgi:hypothetical protein